MANKWMDTRGSGTDKNSDTRRLMDPENFQDKLEEDSFPASDPPSRSPITGIGARQHHGEPADLERSEADKLGQHGERSSTTSEKL